MWCLMLPLLPLSSSSHMYRMTLYPKRPQYLKIPHMRNDLMEAGCFNLQCKFSLDHPVLILIDDLANSNVFPFNPYLIINSLIALVPNLLTFSRWSLCITAYLPINDGRSRVATTKRAKTKQEGNSLGGLWHLSI